MFMSDYDSRNIRNATEKIKNLTEDLHKERKIYGRQLLKFDSFNSSAISSGKMGSSSI